MDTSTPTSDHAEDLDLPGGAHAPVGPDLPEEVVEVRRDGPLSAVVALLAGAVAVLYLTRAVGGGSTLDWVLTLLVGAVAVAHLAILVDSRAPLMVLDAHGVRTRRGRVWEGIGWGQVTRVEHTPRSTMLRDGRLEFTDVDGRALAVRLSLSTRLAGANWHELTDALVELADGHTHVVERAEDDEVEALEDRPGEDDTDATGTTDATAGPAAVPRPDDDVFDQQSDLDGDWLAGTQDPAWARPDDSDEADEADDTDDTDDTEQAEDPDTGPRPAAAVLTSDDTTVLGLVEYVHDERAHDAVDVDPDIHTDTDTDTDTGIGEDEAVDDETPDATPAPDLARTPAPLRDLVTARRSEVLLDRAETSSVAVTPGSGTVLEPEMTGLTGAASYGSETTTLVFDDAMAARVEPVADPVIGNQLAAARTRLGLGVDQLATRTRIRPHVIEAIEVDDFGPCGGDFYARGHLRTLGRVLGVDPEPLVEVYEECYSDVPIDPKRVFSSELAAGPGGSLRSTRGGGFNWSLLVACVMAVVLVWSLARLLTGEPTPLADQPVLDGTPGRASLSNASTAVPVSLTASAGGARVIVRDGSRNSKIVFQDDLAFGQTAELDVVPPVRISSTDGGVEVSVDGQDEGALGETGERAEQVFVPED